ncbi:hypothetical protein [Propionibacterium freudenreichii]|nr:hypothetical protein [Propionibacterium freudenreichii]SBW76091.1 Hypothetical protein PFR_JS22-1_443 [Propionibacterium freudenreichii]
MYENGTNPTVATGAISTVALSTGTWIGIAVGVALLLAIAVFIGSSQMRV